MKYIATLALAILSLGGYSQTNFIDRKEIIYVPGSPEYFSINNSSITVSSENLKKNFESQYLNNATDEQKLELESIKTSPIGTHYRYKHIYKNLPVYQSYLQANFDHSGKLFLIINSLVPVAEYEMTETSNTSGTIWMNTNYGLTQAHRVEQWDSNIKQNAIFYYTTQNKLLYSYDPKLYFHSPDSMVSAMVYLPNPIVAANATYGGGYLDNNDKNSPELSAARSKVRVPLRFENGKFKLINGLITIKNIHDPVGNPIEPSDTFLNYTRNQTGFEDINVYYHLYNYSTYLKKIGFGKLLDSIHVDPHGVNGDDNSFFEPNSYPYQLEYGTGCVDDGEDGQVVIHEFGHSLSVIASPGTTQGGERLAMEEGQADYVAMSYSRSLSKNKPNDVFSWDGHNECWDGFTVKSPRTYEKRTGTKDKDREIYSTALMCIHDKLRNTKSDSLIFSSYFLQISDGKMPQMARVILKLDSMLFGAKELGKIWQCFTDQGILDTVPGNIYVKSMADMEDQIKFIGTTGFSMGISPATILFKNPRIWNRMEIYNNLGQKMHIIKISTDNNTNLQPEEFTKGVYYLKIISNNGETFTKKIIRY